MDLRLGIKESGKDSAVYGISQVLSQVVGFLLLPVYTRYLSPHDYCVLAMLALIPLVFPALANLGLNNAVFRFYRQQETERDRQELIGTAHILVVLFSTFLLILCIIFLQP